MARRRRSGSDSYMTSIISIMFICIFAGVIIFGVWKFVESSQKPGIDSATSCPKTGPVAYLAILIDKTDPLMLAHLQKGRSIIDKFLDEALVGTQVSLSTVPLDSGSDQITLGKICKPKPVEEAEEWKESLDIVQKRYEKKFEKPLEASLDALLVSSTSRTSPIMETLQEFVTGIDGFVVDDKPKKLIIMSNLVQNSKTFSFYRGGDWNSFVESGGAGRLAKTLEGVEVYILRVPPDPRDKERINLKIVDDFWNRYFLAQGILNITPDPLGDL